MYYTVKELSEKYQKHSETINIWLRNGIFSNAYKSSGRWRIPKEDVEKVFSDKNEAEKENLGILKQRKELVGKVFGALTIIDVVGFRKEGSGHGRVFVEIGCECGNIKELPFYQIERGSYKYCSNDCSAKSGFHIGQQIYNLTIIEDLGVKVIEKSRGRRFVKTICICGNRREVKLQKLKSGDIKSCSKHCPKNLKNIIGEKYGRLTVLHELERNEANERMFLCECECGKKVPKRMNKLQSGVTKYCWHDCLLKSGANSIHWKEELSWEDRVKGRDYFEYYQWRIEVLKRNEMTCQCCQQIGGNLAVHHKDGYNWCIEKRTDVHNGVTLCEECHIDFHKQYGFGDNTEEQYLTWIKSKKVSV